VAAREALRRAKLWSAVEPKLVMGQNVRQALQYAESGNAEAAIVAWPLVMGRGGFVLSTDLHEPIRQAGGVVKSSRQPALGRRFLEFLVSDEGRSLLGRAGFLLPPKP